MIVASVLSGPAEAPPPDQLLGPGSCVTIDDSGAAVEVTCDGPHDAVVVEMLSADGLCPAGTAAHRDRQGLGLACVVPPEQADEGDRR